MVAEKRQKCPKAGGKYRVAGAELLLLPPPLLTPPRVRPSGMVMIEPPLGREKAPTTPLLPEVPGDPLGARGVKKEKARVFAGRALTSSLLATPRPTLLPS